MCFIYDFEMLKPTVNQHFVKGFGRKSKFIFIFVQ